jgi:hypothetical protein
VSDQQLLLKIISTLAILLPLSCSLIGLRTSGILGRMFLLFLLAGLFTDVALWYLYYHPVKGLVLKIFNFYSLMEALFFFWLIRRLAISQILRSVTSKFLYATGPVWIAGFYIYPLFIQGQAARSVPFDTGYEVIVSFLAGFALLHLAEREDELLKTPDFWLLLAIFFYCFCTFFIMSMLGTHLSQSLWPLNNLINITTYILYSIGLLRLRHNPART